MEPPIFCAPLPLPPSWGADDRPENTYWPSRLTVGSSVLARPGPRTPTRPELCARRRGAVSSTRHHTQRPLFSPVIKPASTSTLVWWEIVGWVLPERDL